MLDTTGTALLTIRAWCEDDARHPLRAQIRLADDVASGYRSTVTVVHADAVLEAVRDFLGGVLCPPSDDPSVTPESRDGDG